VLVERSMLRGTGVMDVSSAMARGNRHQQGVGGLFFPLVVDAGWVIMDPLAAHSAGHLGFE
jgi:hypothetical protein